MEMQLNPKVIKQFREDRAWSQNQLAEVADLSLRTTQRIEKSGVASYESAQALAAAFGSDLTTLSNREIGRSAQTVKPLRQWARLQGLVIGLILSSVGILFLSSAQAQQVALDIGFATGDQNMRNFRIVTPSGQVGKIGIDDQFQLELIPTADPNGLMLITVNFYRRQHGQLTLIAKPTVLVKESEIARIEFGSEDKQESFSLWITPSIAG